MKIKKIQTLLYRYGDEEKIKQILYKAKKPLLIKIHNFTDQFSISYFEKYINTPTTYSTFENNQCIDHQPGDFATVLSQIKNNQPLRIFAQRLPIQESTHLEKHVPLWQTILFRPRYFNEALKVSYFFGGKGAHTPIHFDREHCHNLHLCLSGKKELLLFTEEQSDHIYKVPFIGDSFINFSYPIDILCEHFPRLKKAQGYRVTLEKGDMLFMPKNCWHFTRYLEASAAATYVFYPRKILQWYGYFTGYFFLGYKADTFFKICDWPLFKKFSTHYALTTGIPKYCFKLVESVAFLFLLPVISILAMLSFKFKPRRIF